MNQNLETKMNWSGPFPALKSSAKILRRQAERALSLDVVKYQGLSLPPPHLRSNGKDFRDDSYYISSARSEAHRLVEEFGLQQTTKILDIGCGAGRLPIGVITNGMKIGHYNGVDVSPAAIHWCKRYITKSSPNFTFHLIDAAHKKYNQKGKLMDETFALTFKDRSFDIIYLYGLFSQMYPNDVFLYCKEISRLLRSGGNVFLTAFIEENVSPFVENPEEYAILIEGPLSVSRYSKEYFYSILQSAGLKVEAFHHGTEHGSQSGVHLRHA